MFTVEEKYTKGGKDHCYVLKWGDRIIADTRYSAAASYEMDQENLEFIANVMNAALEAADYGPNGFNPNALDRLLSILHVEMYSNIRKRTNNFTANAGTPPWM